MKIEAKASGRRMRELSHEALGALRFNEAFLQRLDEKNFGSIRYAIIAFGGIAAFTVVKPLIEGLGGQRSTWVLLPAALNLIVTCTAIFVIRKLAAGSLTSPSGLLRRCTGVFLYVEFLLLVLSVKGDSSVLLIVSMLYPVIVVFWFRLLPLEVILLHTILFFTTLGAMLSGAPVTTLKSVAAAILLPLMFNIAAAVAGIEGVRHLRELVESEHRSAADSARMRDELQFARDVQLSMLPESPPAVLWLDAAGLSRPATEVGGDYYDYVQIDDERIVVVCADVAGHGLSSGLVLAALRTAINVLREALSTPAAALLRLDDAVRRASRKRMLVTASLLLLDRSVGRATLATAGHPPMLIKSAMGVEFMELFSPPLGARLRRDSTERVIAFTSGDVLILYSDGLFETRDASGEIYGFERLSRSLNASNGSATEIRDALLHNVDAFRADAVQEDDITLVVLRIV